MFNVSTGLSPEIVNELFQFGEEISYELRQRPQFQIPQVHSVFSGRESLKFLGWKIWALVPNEIKQLESLGEFRNAIKRGNLHPVLADYEKDIFTRLGFFNKNLF